MTKQRVEGSGARGDREAREGARERERANQDDASRTTTVRRPMRVRVGEIAREDPHTDNQDAADEYADVSLELLAMLSPHGTTQQWEDDEDNCRDFDDGNKARRLSALARMDLVNVSRTCKTQSRPQPDLTSPTQHIAQFKPSPTHSTHGNELDLVSPVGLPESPRNYDVDHHTGSHEYFDCNSPNYDGDNTIDVQDEPEHRDDFIDGKECPSTPSRPSRQSVRKPCSPRRQAWTPGKTSIRYPTAPTESKPKARHGGIYSLLLKNKSRGHEPTLVDDVSNLLELEGVRSCIHVPTNLDSSPASPTQHWITKRNSPPSIGKLQHGGIYAILRRNSKTDE